ncbi:hypothetical protein IscW_ISCW002429 [Ixodes scapularis]|uniref:Uncharacterized protein n=1 Tax=Ixodes scapularis TaxID=6945 RepID=B7PDF2_IXOSC|nr:hypothetical protein IscW_ISCW002429 [Ixodes scapularis]|eukprot:XP_002410786.1 hypothetical protein IscW_ISCW002429 [Ixodes scapularis]
MIRPCSPRATRRPSSGRTTATRRVESAWPDGCWTPAAWRETTASKANSNANRTEETLRAACPARRVRAGGPRRCTRPTSTRPGTRACPGRRRAWRGSTGTPRSRTASAPASPNSSRT